MSVIMRVSVVATVLFYYSIYNETFDCFPQSSKYVCQCAVTVISLFLENESDHFP
jgi:hypothetical protein